MRQAIRDESRRLKAAIHALAAQLGLDDETRWQLQQGLTGVWSCRDMTVPQLRQVAARLRALGAERGLFRTERRRTGRDERRPEELATIEQTRLIEHLFADLELRAVGPLPRGWRTALCKRICGHVWPQSRREANAVVEALKAMRDRGWRPVGVTR